MLLLDDNDSNELDELAALELPSGASIDGERHR
jgi:hypothetical protein